MYGCNGVGEWMLLLHIKLSLFTLKRGISAATISLICVLQIYVVKPVSCFV